MTTRSSPPSIPASDVTVTEVKTTPIWRLIGTAAAIGGITFIGYHLALTERLTEFSVVVGSATAFLAQHIIFRDPDTVRRLAGVWAPMAESILNMRRAAARRRWTQLAIPALAYGALVLLMQKAVLYAASFFATWWVAAGAGLIVISLVVMPEMWRTAGAKVSRLGPKSAAVDEDDELLALPVPAPAKPSPARKVPATRVRLILPAGEVQAERLEKALTARGMADVEGFVTTFNSRTAGRAGDSVPVAVSIYDDGTFSFTVADEEG